MPRTPTATVSHSLLAGLSGVILHGILPAQAVVPSIAHSTEGNSVGLIAGFEDRLRQQFVLHERGLRSVAGSQVHAIEFRRNQSLGSPYEAATCALTVRVAPTTVSPALVDARFARNRPDTIPVFSGTVQLPASPELSGPVTWSANHTVRIPFSRPVAYPRGSHLCIDVEGTPNPPHPDFAWPVDFVDDSALGTVTAFGDACGATARAFEQPLFVDSRNLVAGGNIRLTAHGRRGTPGMLLVGPRTGILRLDSLGMAGCSLGLNPVVLLPLTYGGPGSAKAFPSARLWIDIPRHASVLGATFAIQAANLESGSNRSNPPGVTTTNALELGLANGMVDPDWTTIQSEYVGVADPLPTHGTIYFARVPTLRLRTR